jgi:predicted nucleotidyltransferase
MTIRGGFGRVEKLQAAAQELEDELRKRGVIAVYVFGSVARGEDGPASDIDIAVEVSSSHQSFDAWDLGWVSASFQGLMGCKVDVLLLSGTSEELRRRVTPDLRQVL